MMVVKMNKEWSLAEADYQNFLNLIKRCDLSAFINDIKFLEKTEKYLRSLREARELGDKKTIMTLVAEFTNWIAGLRALQVRTNI
jgi:hypothetical protein